MTTKVLALLAFAWGTTLAAGAQAQTPTSSARPQAIVHHAVSTNAAAQAAFDRGLLDYYAYNPEAAEHEFYTAADLDAHLAMAYWGIALANAPNLNVSPTDDRDHQASRAIAKAKALEAYATDEDRALIDAAAARFDGDAKTTTAARLAAYGDALKAIALANPDDPDAASLYAEAALYVAYGDQGDIWDTATAAQKAAFVARVARVLPIFQAYLAKFPLHVGLLHFYIHAAQFADQSQVAMLAAKQLAAFEMPPEESHLTHMPGHTFFRLGMYEEALDAAQRSVAMDDADFACCHPGYYSAPRYYRGHTLSFLLYALTQTGRADDAVAASRRDGDVTTVAKQLLAASRWQDVVALPYVKGRDGTLAFARGVAYAKLGDAAAATQALADIPDAAATSSSSRVVAIAALRLTLEAQIALLAHDDDKALHLLQDASAAAAEGNGAEIPAMYYYSPNLALAELATRLGKLDVAKAALQAELLASPRSTFALAELARLQPSR